MEEEIALVLFVICFFAYWTTFVFKLKNAMRRFELYEVDSALIVAIIGSLAFGFLLITTLNQPGLLSAVLLWSCSFTYMFFFIISVCEQWFCRSDWKQILDSEPFVMRRR